MSVTPVYGNYSDNALRQLVKNGSVSKQIDALCEASGNGNLKLMRALCQSGISPHVLDGLPERRPLIIASKCRHSRRRLPLMAYLVKAGANINLPDINNKSVLHYAMSDNPDYYHCAMSDNPDYYYYGAMSDNPDYYYYGAMSDNPHYYYYGAMSDNPDYDQPLLDYRDYDRIMDLIRLGANVNAKDDDNQSVLHLMLHSDSSYANISMLIDKGADLCAVDNDGKTPLYIAAMISDEYIVTLLLGKGANVAVKDNNNRTPLHVAVKSRYKTIAKLLIDKGADVCAKDNHGRTPLHEAIHSINKDIVRRLKDKDRGVCANDNAGNIKDDKYHSCDMIELLLDNGADVNAIDKSGESPLKYMLLHYSYLKGNIVKLLIRHGALVGDLVNDYVRLNLLCAVKYNRCIKSAPPSELAYIECMLDAMDNDIIAHVCNCLIKHLKKQTGSTTKFDTNLLRILIAAADFKTRNHIFHCIIDHDAATESVVHSILTEHKSDIDGKDSHGKTLLHKATKLHYSKIVQFLVKYGINVNAMDNENSTALHQACTYIAKLRRFNYSNWDILETGKCLVKAGASVDAKDSKNSTPLHITLLAGNALNGTYEELSQFLIEHGADVNAQDDYKRTPLHIATKSGCLALTKMLLHDHAADVNKSDCYGTTPLHEAAKHGTTGMVNCLISHGADLYAKDCNDKTPMQHAIDRKKCLETFGVCGATEGDILLHFVEQRGFPADLMTSYMYGSSIFPNTIMTSPMYHRRFGSCGMSHNDDEDDDHEQAFAKLHRLVRVGCGIDRKDELDGCLPTLFRMNKLYVLLYLMSAGLFPTMFAYRKELERFQDLQIRKQTRCEKQEKPNKGKSFLDVLMDKFTKPQSLKLLCRDNIRQTLYRAANGTEIVSVIGDMSAIPTVMKSFLCLEGLNSMLSQSAVDDYAQYYPYRDYCADNYDDHNDDSYDYSYDDYSDDSYDSSYDDYSDDTDDGFPSLFE